MKLSLNTKELQDSSKWEEAGYHLPKYDREMMIKDTVANPTWIHFGSGNIFRAFLANVQEKILNQGKTNKGIIVSAGFNVDIIKKMYQPNDNLSLLVTLKADGSVEKRVIGSIAESLSMDTKDERSWTRLKEIFSNPSLQMVSFTITEKGYSLINAVGEYLPTVLEDFERGPNRAESYIGKLTALLYERYLKGKKPIALVSMDNFNHNGEKLHHAVLTFAQKWMENKLVDKGFETYINDESLVTFPWSMIDKITPRPDDSVRELLRKDGFQDVDNIKTSKESFIAPFVNAEESEYLVIEDAFPNGRPNLEEGGVIFTDRDTVNKVEKMKVGTCLNPLHTALAIFGCLLGHTLISEEMKDPELKTLVERIGYDEGLPVVVNPGIIDPKEFIREVLELRFPNPFMPDTPQRIAMDTSQKLSIRFGETIKAYRDREDMNVLDLKYIPLVFAGWCRYLMAIDDEGKTMELSSDPLLDELTPHVRGIKLGDQGPFHQQLAPILSNEIIFGVDLYKVGLGELVEKYFAELVSEVGAVRRVLKKYVY